MGNTRSEFFEPVDVDLWWDDGRSHAAEQKSAPDVQQARKLSAARMAEINEQMSELHQRRLKLIADKKREMDILREEAASQRKENEQLREILRKNGLEPPALEGDRIQQSETHEVPGQLEDVELIESLKQKNLKLETQTGKLQKDLQKANSEIASFENERQEYKTHVIALKDIIAVSKQLLLMRERQIKELSQKVVDIQQSLAEKQIETSSQDLRQEYERQLQSIKQLKALYEERQRVDKTEKDNLKTQLEEAKTSLKAQEDKNSELEARVEELEKENWDKYDSIVNLESQLGFTKAECSELRAEMSVINQLFSQILLGFNSGQEIDLDKLIRTLEENHDLLTEIVFNEESNELSSALPKVLLDLVNQVSNKAEAEELCSAQEYGDLERPTTLSTIPEESESQTSSVQQNSLNRASEIVQNLPKVWKVLAELLSHQSGPVNLSNDSINQSDKNPCYKSVQTPTGQTLVLSVSKTFIRLKNLIIEKKSLEKETTRLKQLNTHLETRLQDQEKRLELVSHELSKTWHVVGKMQKQHQQLHTQEKILRYELAQKRKLLNELKEELEYCREKWLQAREKNSSTEEQWKQLRNEFASRKSTTNEDFKNSIESGYSDERETSSSDDDEEAGRPSGSTDLSKAVSENLVNELTEGLGTADEVEILNDEVINSDLSSDTSEVLADEVIGAVANELPLNENKIINVDTHEENSQDIREDFSSECNSSFGLENKLDSFNINMTLSLAETEKNEEVDNSNLIPDTCESTAALHSCEILKTDVVQNQELQKETYEAAKFQNGVVAVKEELDKLVEQQKDFLVANHGGEIGTKMDDRGSRRKEVDDMYRKLEENILQTIKKTQSGDEFPSTSRQSRGAEEILRAREERLNRLEQESSQLVDQTARTSHKSHEIISKLDSLHKLYGSQNQEMYPNSSNSVRLTTEEMIARKEELVYKLEEQPSCSRAVDLMPEKILVTEEEQAHRMEGQPGSSRSVPRTSEEILARREERLQRMEEQAQELVKKAIKNSWRGLQFCSKLNKLHDRYGESSDDDAADNNNNNLEDADNTENKATESDEESEASGEHNNEKQS